MRLGEDADIIRTSETLRARWYWRMSLVSAMPSARWRPAQALGLKTVRDAQIATAVPLLTPH
jgi:hypothetical protein